MTFSAEVPQPSAPPGLQAQPVSARVVGGGQEAALRLGEAGKGFDLTHLEQLGTKAFGALVKKHEEAEYYRGMARAAQGETAADIEAERPAWASAFGDSDAVAGARYQEQITDSAMLETRVMQAMPETRKLPPEEFAGVLQRNVEALKTGDPTRDLILQASAAQFLPGAMKAHARAHMDWQQKEAAARHDQAIGAVVESLETADEVFRQNPNATDDETMSGLQSRVAQLFIVPPGTDPEAHLGRVTQGMQAAIADGKFATFYAMKDMGLVDKLPVAQRDTLIRSARVAERQYVQEKAPMGAILAESNIKNDIDLDGPELMRAVDKLNKQVQAVTGVRGEFVTPAERAAMLQQREAWRKAAQGKADTTARSDAERAAKQEAERLEVERASKVVQDPAALPGSGTQYLNRLSKPQADLVREGAWAAATALPPAQRIAEYQRLSRVIGGEKGTVPDSLHITVSNVANSEKWTPEVDVIASAVDGMDWDFAAKLQGPSKNVTLLKRYVQIRTMDAETAKMTGEKSTRTPQDMFDEAKVAQRTEGARNPLSKNAESDVQEALKFMNTNSWGTIRSERFLGVKTEIGMAPLAQLARQEYENVAGLYTDPKARATGAVSAIHARGGRTVSGIGFLKLNKDDPEWDDPKYFPGAGDSGYKKDLFAQGFRDEFDRQATRNKNFQPENIVSIVQREVDGKVEWSAIYKWQDDKTGQTGSSSFSITQAAVQASASKVAAKKDKKLHDKLGGDTPGLTDEQYDERLKKLRRSAR